MATVRLKDIMTTNVNFLKKVNSICCMETALEIENEHITEVPGEKEMQLSFTESLIYAMNITCFMEFSQPEIAVFPILPGE